MTMTQDGLYVLSPEECLHLLETNHVHLGRLAYVVDGTPVVIPVNYRAHRGDVLVRLAEGTTLDAVRSGALIAFQVDGIDVAWEEGWSVLVQGTGAEITDPDELKAARALPLRAWAGEDRSHYVRIRPTRLTGRRLV